MNPASLRRALGRGKRLPVQNTPPVQPPVTSDAFLALLPRDIPWCLAAARAERVFIPAEPEHPGGTR